ncbi:MAG: response regulator [Cyanosarcina radialis HA8281-LM2]|jgi:diguanylate cyclase (GGDEF)-like protein|nr:response regulator [Cyanosarcina radialis HA8281-LM2]
MRILIVEDDEFTAQILSTALADRRYAIEVAKDGESAWGLVEGCDYDLILLDVILPKLDGISLCQRLRSHGYTMPILLLTGRDSSHDKAIGLDAGADDYLAKPFELEELVARVRALLRRGNSTSPPILKWGSLILNPSSCEVTYDRQLVHLTPKEYAILELFLRNKSRVFSCTAILDRIWSFDKTPGEEAVRTQIKGLRQKLKAAGAPSDFLETVYGIGYRLKPLEANGQLSASDRVDNLEMPTSVADLAVIWEQFQERMSQQLEILELAANPPLSDPKIRFQAELEAHALAGCLGTFGLSSGSQIARQIEHLLQVDRLTQKQSQRLTKLLAALRQEIERQQLSNPPTSASPESAVESLLPDRDRPWLLIVDGDRQLAENLAIEARIWGLKTEIATDISTAQNLLSRTSPQVVLLDIAVDEDSDRPLELLVELSQKMPSVPVLVFSDRDSLSERIEVAMAGVRAFLPKPMLPLQVLKAVDRALASPHTADDRVMIVDDDPQTLAALRALLEPWGLKVLTLDDPRRFWETMAAFAPDMLILDIKMPYLSGIEICQMVRNDPHWSSLPILVLTSCTDASTIDRVFAALADDFASKPIVGPELIARIFNRLDRIKLWRLSAETDLLTGVSNRHKSIQDLDRLLRLAKRHRQPLCLAVVDLDRFGQINDRYGHMAGDRVLRHVGQLLLRSFRGEDVVARWGGEEFVLGMYGMSKPDGVQRLTKVLENLRIEEFVAPNQTHFRVTFSAGIAQYPADGADLESLSESAEAAIALAKAAGRDRVVDASS